MATKSAGTTPATGDPLDQPRHGTITYPDGLTYPVVATHSDRRYGRIDYWVTPVGGAGGAWKRDEKITWA